MTNSLATIMGFLDQNGLKDMKAGIERGYCDELVGWKKVLADKVFDAMKKCRAEVVDNANFLHLRFGRPLLLCELLQSFSTHLSTRSRSVKNRLLKDKIDSKNGHLKREHCTVGSFFRTHRSTQEAPDLLPEYS